MTQRYVAWASRRARCSVVTGLLLWLVLTLVVVPRVDSDLACQELNSRTASSHRELWMPPGLWFVPSFQEAMHLRSLTERCYGVGPSR